MEHPTAQTQEQVKRGSVLNVVVKKQAPVLELLACTYEALMIRGDAFCLD